MIGPLAPALLGSSDGPAATREVAVGAAAGRGEFARVFAEVIAEARLASAAMSSPGADAAVSGAEAQAAAAGRGVLEQALASEHQLVWLAAPLTSRAIEAYRELMNTSV